MTTQDDVRQIALALPDAVEREDRFAFAVPNKGRLKDFAWIWLERIEPNKPRVPRAEVIVIRVRSQDEKHALVASDHEKFFTEPHYNNFPAVLVRLSAVGIEDFVSARSPHELVTSNFTATCCGRTSIAATRFPRSHRCW